VRVAKRLDVVERDWVCAYVGVDVGRLSEWVGGVGGQERVIPDPVQVF